MAAIFRLRRKTNSVVTNRQHNSAILLFLSADLCFACPGVLHHVVDALLNDAIKVDAEIFGKDFVDIVDL